MGIVIKILSTICIILELGSWYPVSIKTKKNILQQELQKLFPDYEISKNKLYAERSYRISFSSLFMKNYLIFEECIYTSLGGHSV